MTTLTKTPVDLERQVFDYIGTGAPTSILASAPVGATYRQIDGGSGGMMWQKTSAGWEALGTSTGGPFLPLTGGTVSGMTSFNGGLVVGGNIPARITLSDSPTNGLQIAIGNSSVWGVIGTTYSGGYMMMAHNAYQNTWAVDSWSQSHSAIRSAMIEVNPGGFALYAAVAGKATGNKATFWGSPVCSITETGSILVIGGMAVGGLSAAVDGWYVAPNTKGLLVRNTGGSNKVAVSLDGGNVWQFGDGLLSRFNERVEMERGATTPGSPTTYHLSHYVAGTMRLAFGADGSYAYIQSWSSQPLYLNQQGNGVIVGPGGFTVQSTVTTTEAIIAGKHVRIQSEGGGVANAILAGAPGNSYGAIGFNAVPQSSSGVWKYGSSDFANIIWFDAGNFTFRRAASGTAGNNITWSDIAIFNSTALFAYVPVVVNSYITVGVSATNGYIYFGTDTGYYIQRADATWGTGVMYTNGSYRAGGAVNADRQLRATGWWASGDTAGFGAELGVSSGEAYLYAYNRSSAAWGVMHIKATTLSLEATSSLIHDDGVGTARTVAKIVFSSAAPTGSDYAPDGTIWIRT